MNDAPFLFVESFGRFPLSFPSVFFAFFSLSLPFPSLPPPFSCPSPSLSTAKYKKISF